MEHPVEQLKKLFKENQAYADSWHDNIAVCILDECADHAMSNRAASRIMKHCFDIETKNPEER